MAYKRTVIGSIVKGKDGKPDYIKMSADVTLKQGDFLNLESKASQLKGLEAAVANGKLSGEIAETIKERLEKIPEFVRFQIVKVNKD
jgi:hypothetical protein